MKVYPEELKAYSVYISEHQEDFANELTPEQLVLIKKYAKEKIVWLSQNKNIANIIGLTTLLFIFILDYLILNSHSALVTILAHGFIIYGFSNYTLHEGAGHNRIYTKKGIIQNIVNNLTRIYFNDPEYYKSAHPRHHSKLATGDDGAYTQFVWPKRFFISLLPLAFIMPFCDYKIHVGDKYTKSRLLSDIIGISYNLLTLLILMQYFTFWEALLIILASYHVAFYLDRLRETTEHNLMINTHYGARNMGSSLAGLIVGGGPWGQPYHLSHHLEPALPWYFQISMHYKLKEILTPMQQKYYFINTTFDYCQLLIRVVSENLKIAKKITAV